MIVDHNHSLTFVHIPKTGGTSLRRIVKRQFTGKRYHTVYPSFEVNNHIATLRNRLQSERIDCVMGHFPFGIHQVLDYPCVYITMMRDPVTQFLSGYNFAGEHANNRLHEFVADGDNTIDDYITYRLEEKHWDNLQTRYISGYFGIDEFASDNPETIPTLQPLPATALDQAKANIDEHFAVVGTTERFDETLLLFQAHLDWQNCYYERQNVTKRKVLSRADLTPEQLARIEQYLALDIALYDYVNTRLQQDLDQLGDAPQRLERFQRMNKLYGQIAPLRWGINWLHKIKA